MTDFRVLYPPRPKPQGPQHPADELCKQDLLAIRLLIELRPPDLDEKLRLFTRVVFDRGQITASERAVRMMEKKP